TNGHFIQFRLLKNEVGTEAFSSENQVGTVQHLFALQIVFLSNKKKFPKIVIKYNEERVDVA
ncbi:hypothetical protein, partial [Acinetobacter baumannii]|uniref:hypothetical protein n=1 Tax=Acinetobacter baumannii TaxID=470 RepID=UPI000DEED991